MIRKRTAIFFILLASIVILVHAVVPHDHIHGLVSFLDEHSHSNADSHEHNNTSGASNENNENDVDFCLLNQPAQVFRFEFAISTQVIGEQIIQNFILSSGVEIISPHFFKIPPPFYEIPPSNYLEQITSGAGLRAPPVV